MNNRQSKEQLPEEFTDVLDELAGIRQTIDTHTYPGQAWPVKRPILRRFSWPAIAAAAVLFLAVGLACWFYSRGDLPAPETTSPPIMQTASADWFIPSNIDLSLAGSLDVAIPSVSISSADDFGGLELTVPTLAFPSLTQNRSNNHDF